MEKRGIHRVCLFLIYLVVSLPLLASIAFADSFSVSIHGIDEVAGFRKSNDITIINSSVSITGDALVDSSQVKLVTDPTRAFTCIQMPDGSASCSLTIPQILAGGIYPFQFQAFKDDLTPSSAVANAQVIVDDSPAKPFGLEVSSKGKTVNVTVAALDLSCAACPPTVCSGIEKIVYLLNNLQVKAQSVKTTSCVLPSNSTVFNVSIGLVTENRTLCVEVYDRLLQKISECRTVTIDGSPPALVNISVWKGDTPLFFTTGKPETITIKAIIKDDSGIDPGSMVADFSIINSIPQFSTQYRAIDNSTVYKNVYEGCKPTAKKGLLECSWKNLVMILAKDVTPQVRLSFKDVNGNLLETLYTLPVTFDNVAPKVVRIRSQGMDAVGRNWIGKYNNTITADIEERGSGFSKRGIVLDIAEFGPQPTSIGPVTKLFPQNCSSGWSCVWNYLNVTSSTPKNGDMLTVNVVSPSRDDAGNTLEGNTIGAMYLDLAAPAIVNITGSRVCPVSGEDITLLLNVTERESGMVKASVHAPALSLDRFPKNFDCAETTEEGKWLCAISIGNLPSYYVKDFVNITISDLAGNKNTTSFLQEVCESAPGSPPNLVGVSDVKIFPRNGIDRQVAQRISFPLFFQPFFSIGGSATKIQKVSVGPCSIAGGTVKDAYVVTEFLYNNPLTSTKITFTPEALKNTSSSATTSSNVKMSCAMRLIVRSGTKVFKEPEIENVTFEVPLHGTLFGEITKTVNDKIAAKQAEIDTVQERINDLQKWVTVLGTICTIAEVLAKIIAALQILHVALWGIASILVALGPFFETAGTAMYKSLCPVFSYITAYGIPTFWQTDLFHISVYPTSPGTYLKLICAFVTCRFHETSNFVELFGNTGTADGGNYGEFIAEENKSVAGKPNKITVTPENPTDTAGKLRESSSSFFSGPNLLSVYRSKPFAQRALCMPGILYGLKKERQVKCMTRNCYRDFASSGFSPAICDRMEGVRTCLYVDGAAFRVLKFGVWFRWFSGILEWFVTQFIGSSASTGLNVGMGCPWPLSYFGPTTGLPGSTSAIMSTEISNRIDSAGTYQRQMCGAQKAYSAWRVPACSIGMATVLWLDVGDWLSGDDFDWNYYTKKLESPDFCER